MCDNVAAFQLVTVWRGAPGGRRAWTPTASAWSRWARTAAVPCTGTSTARGCTRRTRCRAKPTESWLQTGNSPHASPSPCPGAGARGARPSQPGWRGLRLTAVVPGGAGRGAWRGAARAGPELPSRLGAAPRRALCRSLCGTGRACCGSDAACPTAFLPVCPAPFRAVPAAPRPGSQPVGIPPLPSLSCCCSDLIPPLVGFLAAVPISVSFSHPASLGSVAGQIFHGGFAIFQGMWGADKHPKCSWENRQETRATSKAEKTTGGKFAEVWKGSSCNRRKIHTFPEGSIMYFWGSPNNYVYTMQP